MRRELLAAVGTATFRPGCYPSKEMTEPKRPSYQVVGSGHREALVPPRGACSRGTTGPPFPQVSDLFWGLSTNVHKHVDRRLHVRTDPLERVPGIREYVSVGDSVLPYMTDAATTTSRFHAKPRAVESTTFEALPVVDQGIERTCVGLQWCGASRETCAFWGLSSALEDEPRIPSGRGIAGL